LPRPLRKPRRADPGAVFVDTSAFIALFSRDDANHGSAESLLTHAIATRKRLLTSNLVLAEVHRLLLFRAGIRAAAVALDKIMASSSVKLQFATAVHQQRARAWLDKLGDQVITLTDATSFSIMEGTGCRQALTFDRDFWIAGFEPFQSVPRGR
jgi:predicted nucleic acid-binding protein